MVEAQQNGNARLNFFVTNGFRDIYVGYLLLACMPPFLWLNLGFFIFNAYHGALPFLFMKDYVLFGLTLAYNLTFVSTIMFLVFLALTTFMFFTKKLKGAIGEHEYSFDADGFTEKTKFNNTKLSYDSLVRFCESRMHYLLVLPNMNVYMLPKGDMKSELQFELKKALSGVKPLKKLIAPYVIGILIIISWVGLVFSFSLEKYTVTTNPAPFQAAWNSDSLYILGGKTMVGQRMIYKDMLGIGRPAMNMDVPEMVTEQYLWVVRDGKVNSYSPETDMQLVRICLNEDKLYAVFFNMKNQNKLLAYLTPDAFVPVTEGASGDMLKICRSEEPQDQNKMFSAVNAYEWDEKVGKGKLLSLSLGGVPFEFGMSHSAIDAKYDQNPLGDFETETLSLVGGWIAGQAQKTEKLYTVTSGMKTVSREIYMQYFKK